MTYLSMMVTDADFELLPKLRNDMWQRFKSGPPRKLQIGVASPESLSALDGQNVAAATAIKDMGNAYDAPYIEVAMSMGHRDGELAAPIKDAVEKIIGLWQNGGLDLRKMKAVTEKGPGLKNDEINLLDELLSTQDKLNLPVNDPAESYRIRRDFLRREMKKNDKFF